jgi:hypothetical protein
MIEAEKADRYFIMDTLIWFSALIITTRDSTEFRR